MAQRPRGRVVRFLGFLFVLTALFQAPFAIGLTFVLARLGVPFAPFLAIAAAIVAVLLFRGRFRRAVDDHAVGRARLWLVEEPYYVHWCASVLASFLFVPAILVAGVASAVARAPFPIGPIAAVAYAFSLPIAAWGVVVRRRWVRVRTLEVPIAGLAKSFDGYRIAQLSDLHLGGLNPRRRAERLVARVNALGADMIALTGDYVTSGVAFHEDIAAVLGALESRDGSIAVMGNHDYFGDGEPLVSLLRGRGITLLRNERAVVERGGAKLVVAGVEDTWTRRADVDKTMRGVEREDAIIALAHDPQLFPALAARGASLVLSGHTHWGQIAVPFAAARYNVSRFTYRFHAGVYRDGAATLYINPGLGTTGPPVRLGAAPEVTVLVLRPG